MHARGWLSLILLAALVLSWSGVGLAQAASPEGASDQDQGTAINWDEALFVLLVLLLVMAGMIGFEWVHRRRELL